MLQSIKIRLYSDCANCMKIKYIASLRLSVKFDDGCFGELLPVTVPPFSHALMPSGREAKFFNSREYIAYNFCLAIGATA